jgi:hypothetical protein
MYDPRFSPRPMVFTMVLTHSIADVLSMVLTHNICISHGSHHTICISKDSPQDHCYPPWFSHMAYVSAMVLTLPIYLCQDSPQDHCYPPCFSQMVYESATMSTMWLIINPTGRSCHALNTCHTISGLFLLNNPSFSKHCDKTVLLWKCIHLAEMKYLS